MPIKLYRRPGGEVWHYRGTAAGRRLRGSTRTTNKELAQRIAAEVEARAWRRHLDGAAAEVTMAQAALAYRAAEKPTRFLAAIEDHWRDTRVAEITPEAVRLSAIQLYPRATAATRNRQVIVPTAAIINYAAELGWCAPIKVRRFPINPKVKRPVSREWVEAFAAHASPHLGALAVFLFGTGARLGEALRLRWRDVDMTARSATIRVTKPRPWSREAHLPPALVAALANIPSNRRPDELVFGYAGGGSVKQPWDAAVRRAEIERLTPHSCRHGFATAMLRAGFDVKTIAKRGGWKDPSVVLRTYAHALEDPTVTDVLFDTNPAQETVAKKVSVGKNRRKGG